MLLSGFEASELVDNYRIHERTLFDIQLSENGVLPAVIRMLLLRQTILMPHGETDHERNGRIYACEAFAIASGISSCFSCEIYTPRKISTHG